MKNQLNAWQLTKQTDMTIRLSKKEKNSPVLDRETNRCWNPQFKNSFDKLEKDLKRDIETTSELKNVLYKMLLLRRMTCSYIYDESYCLLSLTD